MSKSNRKGFAREEKLGEAIIAIKEENALLAHGIMILDVKHGAPGSDLQRRRADYLVLAERLADHKQFPIPINAKSSKRYKRKFDREMEQAGLPHIRSIAVTSHKLRDGLRRLKAEVIQCLKTAIEKFESELGSLLNEFREFFDDPDGDETETRLTTRQELRRHVHLLRKPREQHYFNSAPIHRGDWQNRRCCFAA